MYLSPPFHPKTRAFSYYDLHHLQPPSKFTIAQPPSAQLQIARQPQHRHPQHLQLNHRTPNNSTADISTSPPPYNHNHPNDNRTPKNRAAHRYNHPKDHRTAENRTAHQYNHPKDHDAANNSTANRYNHPNPLDPLHVCPVHLQHIKYVSILFKKKPL